MTSKESRTPIEIIPAERIERRIYLVRRQKIMVSSDLADLYGVPAKQLNQAVRRNIERFPADFMFQLSPEEFANLKSQIAVSSWGGARRARPYAFTEEGIAMLSAVLRSPTAVAVSIQIIRVFVRLRALLASHAELQRRLDELERKMAQHDGRLTAVFDAIRQLMAGPPERIKPPIGYLAEGKGRAGTPQSGAPRRPRCRRDH